MHVLMRLAAIRLEVQRQLAVVPRHADVCRSGGGQGETGEECKREHAVKRDQSGLGHGYLPFSRWTAKRRCSPWRVARNTPELVLRCQRFMTRCGPAQALRVAHPAQQLEVFPQGYQPAA